MRRRPAPQGEGSSNTARSAPITPPAAARRLARAARLSRPAASSAGRSAGRRARPASTAPIRGRPSASRAVPARRGSARPAEEWVPNGDGRDARLCSGGRNAVQFHVDRHRARRSERRLGGRVEQDRVRPREQQLPLLLIRPARRALLPGSGDQPAIERVGTTVRARNPIRHDQHPANQRRVQRPRDAPGQQGADAPPGQPPRLGFCAVRPAARHGDGDARVMGQRAERPRLRRHAADDAEDRAHQRPAPAVKFPT